MNNNKLASANFLGRGLGFPPSFEKAGGKLPFDIQLVVGSKDIEQSLHILLSTRPGERPLLPDYGCNLDRLIFEPLTVSLISLMKDAIKTAIYRYEPRIVVNSLSIDSDDAVQGRVLIQVDYSIRSNNSRFNFVFPFYRQEGTDIER